MLQRLNREHLQTRLESTAVPMLLLPLSVIAYGWVCERHVSVAAICVMLFLVGFFSMYVPFCLRDCCNAAPRSHLTWSPARSTPARSRTSWTQTQAGHRRP